MMILKFILIFLLTLSTFDSAIITKLKGIIIHTQNVYYAGTNSDIRISLHSEHSSYVKTMIVHIFSMMLQCIAFLSRKEQNFIVFVSAHICV